MSSSLVANLENGFLDDLWVDVSHTVRGLAANDSKECHIHQSAGQTLASQLSYSKHRYFTCSSHQHAKVIVNAWTGTNYCSQAHTQNWPAMLDLQLLIIQMQSSVVNSLHPNNWRCPWASDTGYQKLCALGSRKYPEPAIIFAEPWEYCQVTVHCMHNAT